MRYFTTDQEGITQVDPGKEDRLGLLESVLSEAQADFPEVYLTSNNGLVIGYRSDGCLMWEEAGEVTKFLPESDLQLAMKAWDLLIDNDRDQLDSLDWVTIE